METSVQHVDAVFRNVFGVAVFRVGLLYHTDAVFRNVFGAAMFRVGLLYHTDAVFRNVFGARCSASVCVSTPTSFLASFRFEILF